MNSKLQIFLYGFGVFAVYMALTAVLTWFSDSAPKNPVLFGIYTEKHIAIGFAVAIVLTISHERKKKMMK